MWTLVFWKATAERAVKTFAQTLAALLVADGTDLLNSAWVARLSVAGMAALVSVLTSVGSETATGDPSLTRVEFVAKGKPHDGPVIDPTGYGSGV
jgi:hypothetical protein